MALLSEIMDALGQVYPWELAADDPSSGLLCGSPEDRATRVWCSVGVSEGTLRRAADEGVDLVVVHDPFFAGAPREVAGRAAARECRSARTRGIGIIGCCRNLAVSPRGTAGLTARDLGVSRPVPVLPVPDAWLAKVVVFVPDEALEEVFLAMAGAGAGALGDYTHAGFRTRGTGTFLPGAGANPFKGRVGRLEFVDETRLEIVCPSFLLERVAGAMLEAHPYEEVAYDVYRTETPVPWGYGRIGNLESGMPGDALQERIAGLFPSADIIVPADGVRAAARVAVAPGAGDRLLHPALDLGAEIFITGELNRKAMAFALEAGVTVAVLGFDSSHDVVTGELVRVLEAAAFERDWSIEIKKMPTGGKDGD